MDTKQFWHNRALRNSDFVHSLSNLSEDETYAREKHDSEYCLIKSVLSFFDGKFINTLDYGAGTCQWSNILSPFSSHIVATDTSSSMLDLGKKYCNDVGVSNISFMSGDNINSNLIDLYSNSFDLVFVSGVILYMKDHEFVEFLHMLSLILKSGAYIFLREPVGTSSRVTLDNVFSQELNSSYSAIYRTESEIITSFNSINLSICSSQWFHPDGSKFNKWTNTRLKSFLFH